MSARSRKLNEAVQYLNIISKNPQLMDKSQSINALSEILSSFSRQFGEDVNFVNYPLKGRASNEDSSDQDNTSKIDEICQKVRMEVLEQVRSDISRLLDATKKDAVIEEMTRALSESIKNISALPDVRKMYVFLEPNNLHLTVIHQTNDRLDILRRIVVIQNLLDSKFEDVYFDIKVLHSSEVDENLTSDSTIVFERS